MSGDTLSILLQKYVHFEVQSSMNACLSLEEMVFELQKNLQTTPELQQLTIVSPFSKFALTEHFYTILTNYCLKFGNDLYTVIAPEIGAYSGNTSKIEFQFQMYYNGSYSTSEWPCYFGRELPDLWEKSSLEAIYHHGCFYHPHISQSCPEYKNLDKFNDEKNGATYEDKLQAFESRMEAAKLNYPNEIDKVTIKNECNFRKYLKSAESRLFKESELFDQ